MRPAARLLVLMAMLAGCDKSPTEPDAHLVFDNQTTIAIKEAGFSTCDDLSGFGPNLLKTNLLPGNSASFGAKPGCYDMQVIFVNGQDRQEWSVTVQSGQTKTWTIR